MKELTDGGISYPRTRLYSQDYKQVLFDTAHDGGDPVEWFKTSEYDWLGIVKDFSDAETWKSRWSGRIEKQDDGSTRTYRDDEFLKYMLIPTNPFG
jgi:hypothetical protein